MTTGFRPDSDYITLSVTTRRLPGFCPGPRLYSSGKRQPRRRTIRRELFSGMAALALTLLIALAGHLAGIYAAGEPRSVYKYYKEIRVERGDSLWSIAEEYCGDEYADLRDYIREVCELNGIAAGQVYYGEYLTIPYYSSVLR